MPRLTPLKREDLPELEDVFARAEKGMGFVPTSFFMMARRPETLRAFSKLTREVLGVPGLVPKDLKNLVAYVASRSAGCQYCSAHMGTAATDVTGVPPEKVAAAFEYETSPFFSDAEKAALNFAQAAAAQPNMVNQADVDALLVHFSEDQIVELLSVVCMFGWLNRWNDTMATALEDRPKEFAEQNLAASGWEIGVHDA